MIASFAYHLAKYNGHFAALALLLVIIMAFHISVPEIESDLSGYTVDNNPYDATSLRMSEAFASRYMVQVMVIPGTTDPDILYDGLKDIRHALQKEFPDIRIESIDDARRLLSRTKTQEQNVRDILTAALDVPLVSNLVSSDTTSFLMIVFIDDPDHFDPNLFDSITDQDYSGIESMLTLSRFHVQHAIEKSIARDYLVLLPTLLLLFSVLLYFTYRNVYAVVICMVNISLSFIPVLFFLSIFGVNINQITAPAIPVVAILSLSGTIHLLTGFFHETDSAGINTRVQKTLIRYLLPSLLSAMTTAAAFGSFVLSNSLYLRQFGLVTACSVIGTFVIVYLVTPFMLHLTGHRSTGGIPKNFTWKLEAEIRKQKKHIAIIFLSILAVSIFLVPFVRFHANLESYIPKNTRVAKNTAAIKDAFHSLADLDMLIEVNHVAMGEHESVAGRRERIALLRDITATIADYPEVRSVQSFADQLDFERRHTMPGIPSVIFSRSNNPFISTDQQKLRVNIKIADPDEISTVVNRLSIDFSQYEPQFQYSIYSDFLFFDFINKSMTASLLRSLLLSSIVIILIILILTRSLFYTIISILANLPPLGFLVLIFLIGGIDMNMTTSISLVVCLGLVVDDTIHILYRRVRLACPIGELGFGILTTSILLAAGFLAFLLSQITPNQVFGVLCAVVFFFAAVSDLAVISWLEEWWQKRKERAIADD